MPQYDHLSQEELVRLLQARDRQFSPRGSKAHRLFIIHCLFLSYLD